MWHKPCRTFHPWCLCIKTRCLLTLLWTWMWNLLIMAKLLRFFYFIALVQQSDLGRGRGLPCFLKGVLGMSHSYTMFCRIHYDVIKWRYWPFVRGIHQSPMDSHHKVQWRRALIFSLICAWTNGKANNPDACDFSRHRAHYDVTVMIWHDDDIGQ